MRMYSPSSSSRKTPVAVAENASVALARSAPQICSSVVLLTNALEEAWSTRTLISDASAMRRAPSSSFSYSARSLASKIAVCTSPASPRTVEFSSAARVVPSARTIVRETSRTSPCSASTGTCRVS